MRPLTELDPDPDDLIVLRYSAYAPRLRPLLDLPHRKLLVYHNVTPPRYFWNHHPGVAVACALGRDQLPRYARAVDVAAADSGFNARGAEAARSAGGPGGAHPLRARPAEHGESGRRGRARWCWWSGDWCPTSATTS